MEMKKYTRKCFLSLSQSKTCTDPEGLKGSGPPHFPRAWILQCLNFVGHILAQDLQWQNSGRPSPPHPRENFLDDPIGSVHER